MFRRQSLEVHKHIKKKVYNFILFHMKIVGKYHMYFIIRFELYILNSMHTDFENLSAFFFDNVKFINSYFLENMYIK